MKTKIVNWTVDLMMILIKHYKMHENLYKIHHKDYTNRLKREGSLKSIADVLRRYNPKITPELVKKKMHNLRSQFMASRKKHARAKMNGNPVEEPGLWCYPHLKFFLSSNKKPSIKDDPNNANEETVLEDDVDYSMQDYEDSFETTNPSFMKKKEFVSTFVEREDDEIYLEEELEEEPEMIYPLQDTPSATNTDDSMIDSKIREESHANNKSTVDAKRFKKMLPRVTQRMIKELKSITETLKEPQPDDNEFDCFAKSVSCQLKKLPESMAIESMAFIQNYLAEKRIKAIQENGFSLNSSSYK